MVINDTLDIVYYKHLPAHELIPDIHSDVLAIVNDAHII